ncbi:hypothetical protein MKX01_035282 [Papaver californicum]|nr:hypothetical protein MKX01_035282 [Papaver californicum]
MLNQLQGFKFLLLLWGTLLVIASLPNQGLFTQDLVNPGLLKVLGKGDCVVNDGLPLGPLQKISFSYTHTKFNISTSTWYFQCE